MLVAVLAALPLGTSGCVEEGIPTEDSATTQLDSSLGLDLGGPSDTGGAADIGGNSDVIAPPDSGPADVPPATGCAPTECRIDGACHANGTPNPANGCEACVIAASQTAWSAADGGSCDDGDACTVDDACVDGGCAGVAKVCNDDDPCTDDACDAASGGCTATQNTAPCDDGDPCSLGDACGGGACLAGAATLACDDGDPCTDDACTAGTGCTTEPRNGGDCDDGDACTATDTCVNGACVGTAATTCDDQNICTLDACDRESGDCLNISVAEACTDDNPCTDEGCDAVDGCVFPFNANGCDDDNPCTVGDACAGGACLGQVKDISDGNPCTDDLCDPVDGESHTANTAQCDDGDPCTLGDQCSGGFCGVGPFDKVCDDGNPCTDDFCEAMVGCQKTDNSEGCDDNDPCTETDTCAAGECAGTEVVCDDQNPCTVDACSETGACESYLVVTASCRPQITVTFPPRAATIDQDDTTSITVTGNVESDAGPIESLTVNGLETQVQADNSFSATIPTTVGGNTLVIEAVDSFGTSRRRVQSFLMSSHYRLPDAPKNGMVPRGMALFLGQEVIDDGDHSDPPDDLASIFEKVFATFDVAGLIDNPVTSQAGYDVNINNLTYGSPTVALTAVSGGLQMTATIPNVAAKVKAVHDWAPTINGDLKVTSIVITAKVALSVKPDHTLAAELQNTNVTMNGTSVTLSSSVLDFLVGWLVDWIVGSFKDDLETSFESAIATQLGPILENALASFAFSFAVNLPGLAEGLDPVALQIVTDFQDVDGSPAGLGLILRAGAYTTGGPPYVNAGAMGRVGCGLGPQVLAVPKQADLEVVLSDDTLNEMLYAMWRGGYFEFPVPPSLLGDVNLGELGVTDLVLTVSGMLQPTASDCADGALKLHIGDLKVTASLKIVGIPMNVLMFASFRTGVELGVTDGEVGISIQGVEDVQTEINVLEDDLVEFEGVLGTLIEDNLVTGLIDTLGGQALGSFPLPEIDLSGSIDGVDAVIAIEPQSNTRIDGNTIIGGTLKQ